MECVFDTTIITQDPSQEGGNIKKIKNVMLKGTILDSYSEKSKIVQIGPKQCYLAVTDVRFGLNKMLP